VYFYGLFVAAFLIIGTVLAAIGINRVREWWEQRGRERRAP
jgi:hypothetical protein